MKASVPTSVLFSFVVLATFCHCGVAPESASEERASISVAASEPAPVPPSEAAIHLPADQYLHIGAPTEWWWHTGTLRAGHRTFGFEINAASYAAQGVGFTQIMLTDVNGNRHFQRTTPYVPPALFNPATWAESDVTRDWSVRLGDPSSLVSAIEVVDGGSGYTSPPTVTITGGGGSGAQAIARLNSAGQVKTVLLTNAGTGYTSAPTVTLSGGGGTGATAATFHSYVTMSAPAADPTRDMVVKALLSDQATKSVVDFDLTLSQHGSPFLVWGTGVDYFGGTGTALQTNNYYYSLTHLKASGSITIDGEPFDVTGVTWMDHEYGEFGTAANPVKWILQDMQLDDGVSISNSASFTPGLLQLNQKTMSHATVQKRDGAMYFVPSFITPIGRTWQSPTSGNTYFLELQVDIPAFDATIVVKSLVDAQEFTAIYEGVASARGTFEGKRISGTAWNEQAP